MTDDAARAFALSLPDTTAGEHRGTPDFRVAGKIFATQPAQGGQLNVKVDRDELRSLVERSPDVYADVWGGRWVGITVERADAGEVQELLVEAWRMTAPPRLRKALDGT
ncbi:MAG: MmcQ/YjbR family DNA-binding protein [Actinobacteria bacterium]|nr:MmcQ/YjbR family DNA-binding protein [Actinomycetota bacterium]